LIDNDSIEKMYDSRAKGFTPKHDPMFEVKAELDETYQITENVERK